MALPGPDHDNPGEERVTAGAVGSPEVQLERRLVRDGVQVIASGALVCPGCELPLSGWPAVRASQMQSCAWCGHSAPARDLLRPGIHDTPANQVELVARISQ